MPTNDMLQKVETLAERLEAPLKIQSSQMATPTEVGEAVEALIKSTNIEKIKWGLEFGRFNTVKDVSRMFLKSINRQQQHPTEVLPAFT